MLEAMLRVCAGMGAVLAGGGAGGERRAVNQRSSEEGVVLVRRQRGLTLHLDDLSWILLEKKIQDNLIAMNLYVVLSR